MIGGSYREGFQQGQADRLAFRPAGYYPKDRNTIWRQGYADGFNGQIDMFSRCTHCGDPVHQNGDGVEYDECTACWESGQIDRAERQSADYGETFDQYLQRTMDEARRLK